jgi:hypothetical protein
VIVLETERKPNDTIFGRGAYYAGQGWGLESRCDFYNLNAVRFVYRYVISLKARFQTVLNVIAIYMTLALCVSCTGTLFN